MRGVLSACGRGTSTRGNAPCKRCAALPPPAQATASTGHHQHRDRRIRYDDTRRRTARPSEARPSSTGFRWRCCAGQQCSHCASAPAPRYSAGDGVTCRAAAQSLFVPTGLSSRLQRWGWCHVQGCSAVTVCAHRSQQQVTELGVASLCRSPAAADAGAGTAGGAGGGAGTAAGGGSDSGGLRGGSCHRR